MVQVWPYICTIFALAGNRGENWPETGPVLHRGKSREKSPEQIVRGKSAELDLDKASDLFLGEQAGTLADNCAVNGDLLYRRC